MPYKINISGEIGWDYTANAIRDSLKMAKGDDLEIDIVTPGGSVFDGIEIFNAIRDYKRENPKSQIMGNLKGLVASMGTYIASNPAFDLITAEDNAVYMIHNPWSIAMGDYRDMQTSADMLQGLAEILSDAYTKKTGKKKQEIRTMMDAETWIFGEDIKAAGFVDEIIPGDKTDEDNKDTKKSKALAHARASFDAMVSASVSRANRERDNQRAAALVTIIHASLPGQTGSNDTAPKSGGKEDNQNMPTLNEFLAQGKEALAEVEAVKVDAVKTERERVKALNEQRVKFAKLGAAAELIDSAIESGESWASIAPNVAALALAALDSPGALNTGHNNSASGENAPELPAGYNPISVVQ